ncbi:MAG: DNA mismatch repair endonuclease MutL [Anaerohalosphaeraceae bacterium]|nr:DNA mismatch repair endonuclease MutL [Anaerohalosphaeraceae bacterium]
MGQIVVLNQNMINMIAAGEVIERPGSVVKELIENSIDAGASEIEVRIEDGGKKLVSVSDNGCGMDSADLDLAFCPHATSKLKTSEDLLNISTMGFRGEALASIGAVGRVSIVSKTAESIEANIIEVDCGQKSGVRPCSGGVGTTIEIRDIFYKLPGRRKFLRTANTETSHISEQFIRTALANTSIAMTLSNNGREIYALDAGMSVKQRIAAMFTSQMVQGLIEVQSAESAMQISGYICTPENVRANSKYQYIFLNGRFIRDKFIAHAVKEAYRGMIDHSKYPAVFLFLKMPPQNFDVNVHPTKVEVRFDNSNFVHSQILSVVREKILRCDASGSISDGLTETNFSRQAQSGSGGGSSKFFERSGGQSGSQSRFDFSTAKKDSDFRASQSRQDFYLPSESEDEPRIDFMQIHNSYLLVETDDGFMMIDQHALHERIIYEQLRKKLAGEGSCLESQKLLIPETFEATDAQMKLLADNEALLGRLGIEAQSFGPGVVAVGAFPTLLKKASPADFVLDMLDMLADVSGKVSAERLLGDVMDMAACKAAIKAGQKLSDSEIRQLLSDKEATESAARCPHGRPTTIRLTKAQLEKQFGRT